ncbi:hypothetical protein EKO27_g664 [Xylaria grammica]|uniref:Uncharacterized protein n=1 Tax=Xylaria grammica TaxID=363999 RepID=A0A439DJ22_9PEZI|nr:hypothetical protein EKO27_g664 [Xylaria grammica]
MPGKILEPLEPLAGCIKWLPHKDALVPPDPAIDEGCCNHPVVILSTGPWHGSVEILIITSFGGRNLETKYPTDQAYHVLARHNYLPITPNRAHPDNGILLALGDPSQKLRKDSYINTRDRHIVSLTSLQPYNRKGPEIFLSERSYQTLVQHISFTKKYVPLTEEDVYLPGRMEEGIAYPTQLGWKGDPVDLPRLKDDLESEGRLLGGFIWSIFILYGLYRGGVFWWLWRIGYSIAYTLGWLLEIVD